MIEPAPLAMLEYRDFIITRAPLHVPHTWEFTHRNYCDGPEERYHLDNSDKRCGYADTLSECYDLIDEQIREGV